MGATFWQIQKNGELGELEPIRFTSRFLSDTEERCNQQVRTTGSTMGIRTFHFPIRNANRITNRSSSAGTTNKKTDLQIKYTAQG